MTDVLFPNLLERAMRVAAIAHRHQTRKASTVPYFAHPTGVALILARAGFNEPEILAAALLHDVIEDTDYTVEQCRSEFPESVVEIVLGTSEIKLGAEGEKLPWIVRKREHLSRLTSATDAVKAVVLADKLHNLIAIATDLADGHDVWSRFNAGRTDLHWYYSASSALGDGSSDSRLHQLASACREQIAALWPSGSV